MHWPGELLRQSSYAWKKIDTREILYTAIGREICYCTTFSAFNNTYLIFRQPIQLIHPPVNLRIDLCNLPLQIADSIQIILTRHERWGRCRRQRGQSLAVLVSP